jgi:hypothetical protein
MLGINTETLSVAKKHYDDMAMLVGEERIIGPRIPLLIDELVQLRIIRGKVDHPRKGSKDLSDAVCGAIYNAITESRRDTPDVEIEFHTYKQFVKDNRREEINKQIEKENIIRGPQKNNDDSDQYFGRIGLV